MTEHPINDVMKQLYSSMKELGDANTVVGNPITTPDGTTIIPISKVTMGFGSGGGDKAKGDTNPPEGNLFSGAGGGGVSIQPVGFLIISGGNVRMLPITPNMTSVDRLIDSVPGMIDKVNGIVQDYRQKKDSAAPETTE